MNYKKFIRDRKTRLRILRFFRFVPDEIMLRLQYRIYMGRKLNLDNPIRFTEKIQWYKLHYKNPILVTCVDKYEVRNYLKKCGFAGILTKEYGVYDSPEHIDFASLPNSFVLKDTLGGGGNAVIIIQNKSTADLIQIKKQLEEWCAIPLVKDGGREWPYYSGKRHRIFIEEYMYAQNGLNDYKFFCFGGKVEFVYCVSERKLGQGGKIHIMTREFEDTGVVRTGDEPGDSSAVRPACYEEMLCIAEELAKPFPHVRVDLYEYMGQVRFGELTFYNASGYMKYDPDEFDLRIGEKFIIK